METIIQQIAKKLINKILEKAYSGGISDIDALSSAVLGDCKEAAVEMIEEITVQLNRQIRNDKRRRKEEGLVLKEKERGRSLLTELGRLAISRDYYYDKKNDEYVYLLDHVIGLREYERVSDGVSAKLVSLATEVPYAKSAQIVAGGEVSRQSVRNSILRLGGIEKEAEVGKPKRRVKELWKSVEGYIGASYELDIVENIYVHGDGGQWIKNGLENFSNVKRLMDGFHLEKRLKEAASRFPNRNLRRRIKEAIEEDDRKKLDRIIQSLCEASEDGKDKEFVSELGKYLFGNYEAIRNRMIYGEVGSCTEEQVSHILSERFSRDPLGWSEEGLGKLTKQRIYIKNRGKIEARDFKDKDRGKGSYGEYAERIIADACEGAIDFSIFERREPVFDGSSGTQTLIRSLSMNRGIPLS